LAPSYAVAFCSSSLASWAFAAQAWPSVGVLPRVAMEKIMKTPPSNKKLLRRETTDDGNAPVPYEVGSGDEGGDHEVPIAGAPGVAAASGGAAASDSSGGGTSNNESATSYGERLASLATEGVTGGTGAVPGADRPAPPGVLMDPAPDGLATVGETPGGDSTVEQQQQPCQGAQVSQEAQVSQGQQQKHKHILGHQSPSPPPGSCPGPAGLAIQALRGPHGRAPRPGPRQASRPSAGTGMFGQV
jgi:hypothetical protein